MDLSSEYWQRITMAEREAIARQLAMQLPAGFAFRAVERYQLGGQAHDVALYQMAHATFALIPGGTVSLGFDASRPWNPNAAELKSWQRTSEQYRVPGTIHEHICQATTRPRQVELAPFLIETAASELGWQPISLDDPEVQEIQRKYGTQKQVEVSKGDTSTRIRTGAGGEVKAERALSGTHADFAEQLKAAGFRFPTSDQWEYACAGGASTLFRWGDHAPCDRYPTDVSPAEAAWRRQWVLSHGKLERPAAGFVSDWDFHRQRNAFGLLIASDPYKYELVAEAGITRGGDGGSMICGGAGFFIGWLTLATAYFEEHSCKYDPTEPISTGYTVGRRVLELR